MKQILPFTLAAFLALSLRAQNPAGGDPFVKTPGGEAAAAEEAGGPTAMLVVYEVYALPQDGAMELLAAEHSGVARYRRVSELRKGGTARLETLSAMTTRCNQRGMLESIDEVRYPTEFDPPVLLPKKNKPAEAGAKPEAKELVKTTVTPREAKPLPSVISVTGWETRTAGETLEVEVSQPQGRLVDINIVAQRIGLVGFRDFPGQAEGSGLNTQPAWSTQKVTTAYTVTLGEPAFLGTLSPAPKAGTTVEVWLTFLRVLPVPQAAAPAKKPVATPVLPQTQLEYSFYSCPRAEALDLLSSWPEAETPWTKLQPLLHEKKARCEHFTTLVTKAGQRTVVEETQEVPMAVDYATYWQGGSAADFDVRNAGLTIQVEPILSADASTVELSHVPQMVLERGPLQYTGSATHFPSPPVFERHALTSSVAVPVGKQMLVGTFNPPPANGVNGRVGEERTWLLFVRCSVEAR